MSNKEYTAKLTFETTFKADTDTAAEQAARKKGQAMNDDAANKHVDLASVDVEPTEGKIEMEIHGHSDDLIYVTGDGGKELRANYDAETLIRVGDYTFTVIYDGEWHFEPESVPENGNFEVLRVGALSKKYNDYTEVVRINHPEPITEVEKVE